LFGEKNVKIPKALAYRTQALNELGKSYCFLIMTVSKAQRTSSEERQWFEVSLYIYVFYPVNLLMVLKFKGLVLND
jgi:hypothetical protein